MRVFVALLLPLFLFSHALKVFTATQENHIKVKSYFSASSPCRECKVLVITNDKKELEFKTDQKGEVLIPLHVKPISITVDGGLGHKKTTILDLVYKDKTIQEQPTWIKAFLVIGFFIFFFAGLRWIKRK